MHVSLWRAGLRNPQRLVLFRPLQALVVYGFHPIQRWRYRAIPGKGLNMRITSSAKAFSVPSVSQLPLNPPESSTQVRVLVRRTGPPPQWLLGNLAEIAAKGQHAAYEDWGRKYGPVFKIFFGGTAVIVMEDPAAVRWAHSIDHAGIWALKDHGMGQTGYTGPPYLLTAPRLGTAPLMHGPKQRSWHCVSSGLQLGSGRSSETGMLGHVSGSAVQH